MSSTQSAIEKLDKRIAELEKQQRTAAQAAGKKGEDVFALRKHLEKIEAQREKVAAREQQLMMQQESQTALAGSLEAPSSESSSSISTQLGSSADVSGGGGSSTDALGSADTSALEPRPARVLLGSCMPHYLGTERVLQQVLQLHEKLCDFVEVRLVCTRDLARVGAERLLEEVSRVSAQARHPLEGVDAPLSKTCAHAPATPLSPPTAPSRVCTPNPRRVPPSHVCPWARCDGDCSCACSSVYTEADQKRNPYHAASALAQWADVLLVAPLCPATLTNLVHGLDNDLLLEVATLWGSTKLRAVGGGEYWQPRKPFLVAPRLPEERRQQKVQRLLRLDRRTRLATSAPRRHTHSPE